jgi:hypothetical protein
VSTTNATARTSTTGPDPAGLTGLADLLADYPLPTELLRVRARLDVPVIDDVAGETRRVLLASGIGERVRAGDEVAIGAGSRGVANLPVLVRETAAFFTELGARPFVFPAMGSHGGATAAGQRQVLADLGVTEDSAGVEIRSSMDVDRIGRVPDGPDLYCSAAALAAQHIFLINRVKPHTDFHGELESGLAKMCVIGLGKREGARRMHAGGGAAFRAFLTPAARVYEAATPLLGGLALVENALDQTAEIHVLDAAGIGAAPERSLLARARELLMRLPLWPVDVLVLQRIGKDISGTGMDTNVVGRISIPRESEPAEGPDPATIAVLDLTDATHGNASGIGLANVTTVRAAGKVDWATTYTNAITGGIFGAVRAALPIVMPTDELALKVAMNASACPPDRLRLMLATDTLHVSEVFVAPCLADEVAARDDLELIERVPLTFTDGQMTSPWTFC